MDIKKIWCFSGCTLFLLVISLLTWTAASSAQTSSQVVAGTEGWLFLEQELRFLNSGPFWGEHAESASRASRADAKDPTPAIVAFHQALAEKGITLLLVPVPPKALIYPEYVPGADRSNEWGESLDHYYKILREQGVRILDLRVGFESAKAKQDKPVYCREDTHWSGYGCTLAADLIAEEIVKIVPRGGKTYTEKWRDIQISGDLRQMLGNKQGTSETILIREILDDSGHHPKADPSSPLLVLGDSHVLVFHDGGDMHARGAGITDQLSFSLAMPLDVIGVRGSGATPVRLSLYRKVKRNSDYWTGKKVVVWCFAAREFTETEGWRVLPIEP
jgi:acetyltransferase AlgX (SGNH hydrolase-like protein)